MEYHFFWLALVTAIIDWIAIYKRWKIFDYILKPSVILILLITVWQISNFEGFMVWFGIALALSLAGDIVLMLSNKRLLAGIFLFAFAHIAYIIGFNLTPPPLDVVSIIIALFILLPFIQVARRIISSIKTSGNDQFVLPVAIYSFVIGLMLFSASLSLVRQDWPYSSAVPVSLGALLFVLSDLQLAWNKFVTPLPHPELRIIIPYHIGQILIISGSLLQYSV